MKVLYVAGPFRGAHAWAVENNVRRAEALALEAWKAGFAVICPHANTRFFQNVCPDETWLRGDLEILRRCDGLLLTDDWASSEGAKRERMMAAEYGLPIGVGMMGIHILKERLYHAAV